jgi:NTP pyrophosphatase (non-canonical NTP hydrolase)
VSLDKLELDIVAWGHEKGILPHPEAMKQYGKTLEEVEELGEAIRQNDIDEVKDAIGDIFVTLVMQCEAWDLTMQDCVQSAYDVIAKRTGKMVNGVFVKDAD